MSYNPTFTNAGNALLIRALSGESLTFTKLQIGNGHLAANEDIKELAALKNPLIDISIKNIERNENNIILIGNGYNNSNLKQDIYWNEIGVFAKGNDNIERLVAVVNSNVDLEYIPNSSSGVPVENNIAVSLIISQSVNVSAVVKNNQYCTTADFEDHINATNPHNMTAEDIGLDKVANEFFSDNIVEFITGQQLSNFTAGSTLKTIVSKLWALIDSYINHKHSASDINAGVLSVARGGTGVTSISDLKKQLDQDNWEDYRNSVQFSSNVYGNATDGYWRQNNTAYLIFTGRINVDLGQNDSLLLMTLPSELSPMCALSFTGQTSSQESTPTVSIQINTDGTVMLYSFGYENISAHNFIRFQATYPLSERVVLRR